MAKNRANRTNFSDEELLAELRDILKKSGGVIYTRVTHVSQSGMHRRIMPVVATKRGELVNIAWHLVNLGIADHPRGDEWGVVGMGGCGMDMCFALVYDIGMKVYGDGYKLKYLSI